MQWRSHTIFLTGPGGGGLFSASGEFCVSRFDRRNPLQRFFKKNFGLLKEGGGALPRRSKNGLSSSEGSPLPAGYGVTLRATRPSCARLPTDCSPAERTAQFGESPLADVDWLEYSNWHFDSVVTVIALKLQYSIV